jgi:hypothetical protein
MRMLELGDLTIQVVETTSIHTREKGFARRPSLLGDSCSDELNCAMKIGNKLQAFCYKPSSLATYSCSFPTQQVRIVSVW